MAAKHAVRLFTTARLVLSFAVAILVLLVVWVAVRAVGPAEASRQPSVVLPSMPQVPLEYPRPPSKAPVKSPSVSPTPSRTSATPRSSSPVPEKTRPTSQPAATTPASRSDVAATLAVGASWDAGYVATVRVTNEGDRPVEWRVTVSHSGLDDVDLRGVWNATGNRDGDTFVFTGGTLEPGRTASFGYQTSTGRGDRDDRVRPSGCNALGGSCRVR